jgi:phage tail-like protein
MAIQGNARTYHKKFRFVVEIDLISYAGFQSCSELSSEFAEIAHYEGGVLIPNKAPGRMTFDDITLMRGVTGDSELYDWHRSIASAADSLGLDGAAFKRNLDIVQLDMAGNMIRRWTVFNAWPKRYVAGDWDNDADENVIEQIVLAYDYFEKVSG